MLEIRSLIFATVAMAFVAGFRQSPPLRVPDGQAVLFSAHAEGVQIYESKAKADTPKALEWVLKAPDATLFDSAGKKIGRHYAGPTWEATDGSKVVGERLAMSPASRPADIPWLLLKAASTSGSGAMSKVSYIMRIDTQGGVPQRPPRSIGQESRVRYKATYIFFGEAIR